MGASWFRLDAALDVDDWSGSSEWKSRCNHLPRRRSTNHFMGSGYWAWVIPLANERTSVGLVTDPEIHSLSSFNSFEKFRRWIAKFEPLVAERIDSTQDTLMDFSSLKDLSRNSERLWSSDNWALTGEAGVFADPFYSPGTDFIAMSNTLTCDLITRQQSDSGRAVRTLLSQKVSQSFHEITMTLYTDQYPGFGDTRLMVIKTTWDYAYYWSILAWLFFREWLTDLDFLRQLQPRLLEIRALNDRMQAHFRARAATRYVDRGNGRFFDQIKIPILVDLNTALLEAPDDIEAEFADNCQRLEVLAPRLLALLEPGTTGQNCSLLGDLHSRF